MDSVLGGPLSVTEEEEEEDRFRPILGVRIFLMPRILQLIFVNPGPKLGVFQNAKKETLEMAKIQPRHQQTLDYLNLFFPSLIFSKSKKI